MITTSYIDGFSYQLRQFNHGNMMNLPDDCLTHILGSKYQRGDDDCCTAVPLQLALTNTWNCDAHFTMYHTPQNVRCLKSGSYDLTFSFCAFDLDFANHERKPDLEDFAAVMRTAYVQDEVPNVVYQTRGGCRWLYLIEHMHDAEEFEAHYQALLAKLDKQLVRCKHEYRIDTQAKDWTRLFRLPWVLRDGVEEFGYEVRILHDEVMDLRTFKPKAKPSFKPRGNGNNYFDNTDVRLIKLLRGDMHEGGRNNAGFRAALHCARNYQGEHLEKALNYVRDMLGRSGLDEREIEQLMKSAAKYEGENR